VALTDITRRLPPRENRLRWEEQLDELGATCSVEQAAAVLGVGRGLAYELARRGELPGLLKLSRRLRVSVPALKRALQVDGSEIV
jgi:excisionase family DNA binding protein